MTMYRNNKLADAKGLEHSPWIRYAEDWIYEFIETSSIFLIVKKGDFPLKTCIINMLNGTKDWIEVLFLLKARQYSIPFGVEAWNVEGHTLLNSKAFFISYDLLIKYAGLGRRQYFLFSIIVA